MAENVLNTAEKNGIEAAIEIAEELYCDGKSDECDAAFQQLYDRYINHQERSIIVRHWTECLTGLFYEFDEQRQYNEALKLGKKIMFLLEEFPEEMSDELLSAQNNYASCLNDAEHYEQAIQIYKKLIGKCVVKYGKNGHNTLIAMGNMASSLRDSGKIAAAIQIRSHAVNGLLKLHGKNNIDYIRELVNLAEDHSYLGNKNQAIKLLTKAYELRNSNLGEHDSLTTNALNILGSYFKDIMQYSTAISHFEKAIQLTQTEDFYSLIYVVQMARCYALIGQNDHAANTLNNFSARISECEVEEDTLKENLEYVYSLIDINNRNYSAAEAHAEEAVKHDSAQDESAHTSKCFLAEMLFYSGNYNKANKVIEEIHDEYPKETHSANLCLKFECLYANIKSAVGDFQISADALDKAALISRQCRFPAAGFLIASSKAFAAYCRLDMESFDKYRTVALAYTQFGVDKNGLRVRWLEQLC